MSSGIPWKVPPFTLEKNEFILGFGQDLDDDCNYIFKGFFQKQEGDDYWIQPCWRAIDIAKDVQNQIEKTKERVWYLDEFDYVPRMIHFKVKKFLKLGTIPIPILENYKKPPKKTFEIYSLSGKKGKLKRYKGVLTKVGLDSCVIKTENRTILSLGFHKKIEEIIVSTSEIRNIK